MRTIRAYFIVCYLLIFYFQFIKGKNLFFSILNEFSNFKNQNDVKNLIQTTGISLFYKICNFVDGIQFLFPASVLCYESCLKMLGKVKNFF